jgi:hypothetical protein
LIGDILDIYIETAYHQKILGASTPPSLLDHPTRKLIALPLWAAFQVRLYLSHYVNYYRNIITYKVDVLSSILAMFSVEMVLVSAILRR